MLVNSTVQLHAAVSASATAAEPVDRCEPRWRHCSLPRLRINPLTPSVAIWVYSCEASCARPG